MSVPRLCLLACAPLSALALSACASTVSTTAFKGTQHDVAQTVANLQSHATAGEESKICANDLAAAVVARLGGAKRCEATIKSQLGQVDSLELSVKSIEVAAGEHSATAHVKSLYQGRSTAGTIALVKEGGSWKVSGL